MTDIIHVPLSKLTLWDGNVRKTDIHAGINELADSIASHGLLQSLVVRKGKKGKYNIIAGQRRFLALQALAKDGTIDKDCPIPCMLAQGSIDAAELSLAENVVRLPMHPADQFEAFRTIIDGGASIADVAARFGVSETAVAGRLKLARLSPVILDAYRKGEIDLEEAQAFAISDDREAQERVFAELTEWNRDPRTIRAYLTEGEIPASDKRVQFVGIDAYCAAGGALRQDLFDDANSGYLQDIMLLDKLVADKLSTVAAEVSQEGWSWVDIVPNADYQTFAQFKRAYPERGSLSDADQAELARLSREYDELADSDDADENRLAEIEERMDVLYGTAETWLDETLSFAGAIVALDHDGDVRIERGMVRKQDAHKLASGAENLSVSEPEQAAQSGGLSPRLIEDLTAQQSAAIGAELLGRPDIGLAAVVHTLALDALYLGHGVDTCLKLSVRSAGLSSAIAKPETCKGLTAIEQERERIGDRIPGNPADLWGWLLGRSREELLDLLAFIAATSVDAVQRKCDTPRSSRLVHAKVLGQALQLDMTAWFTPTAENYFGRVTRDKILVAIDEAKGSHGPALEKLKKSELAVRAEQLLADSAWLPEPLRISVNDNNDCAQSQSAE